MCSSVTTRPVSAFRLLAILGVASCLAACARPQLETSQVYQGPHLPPPSRILVYDLAVAPGEVRLDQGVSARLMAAAQGGSRTEQEMVAGRQVVAAISNSTVKELRNRGLPAERAVGSP